MIHHPRITFLPTTGAEITALRDLIRPEYLIADLLALPVALVAARRRKLLRGLGALWNQHPAEKIVIFATYLATVDLLAREIETAYPGQGLGAPAVVEHQRQRHFHARGEGLGQADQHHVQPAGREGHGLAGRQLDALNAAHLHHAVGHAVGMELHRCSGRALGCHHGDGRWPGVLDDHEHGAVRLSGRDRTRIGVGSEEILGQITRELHDIAENLSLTDAPWQALHRTGAARPTTPGGRR